MSKASSVGLQLIGSAYYKGNDASHNAIRFGFASIDEHEIAFAVDILKKVTSS